MGVVAAAAAPLVDDAAAAALLVAAAAAPARETPLARSAASLPAACKRLITRAGAALGMHYHLRISFSAPPPLLSPPLLAPPYQPTCAWRPAPGVSSSAGWSCAPAPPPRRCRAREGLLLPALSGPPAAAPVCSSRAAGGGGRWDRPLAGAAGAKPGAHTTIERSGLKLTQPRPLFGPGGGLDHPNLTCVVVRLSAAPSRYLQPECSYDTGAGPLNRLKWRWRESSAS